MEGCVESKGFTRLCKSYKRPWGGGLGRPEEDLRLLPGAGDELQGAGNSWGPSALVLECDWFQKVLEGGVEKG